MVIGNAPAEISPAARSHWGGDLVPYGDSMMSLSQDHPLEGKGGSEQNPHMFSSLNVDHSLQNAAPTLAALTLRSVPADHFVVPSSDLSAHSSSLSTKALSLGLVTPNRYNPKATQTNFTAPDGRSSYERVLTPEKLEHVLSDTASSGVWSPMADAYGMGKWSGWSPVPDEEVHAARAFVRQILSSPESREVMRQSRLQRRSE
jgi:hypothetical protein